MGEFLSNLGIFFLKCLLLNYRGVFLSMGGGGGGRLQFFLRTQNSISSTNHILNLLVKTLGGPKIKGKGGGGLHQKRGEEGGDYGPVLGSIWTSFACAHSAIDYTTWDKTEAWHPEDTYKKLPPNFAGTKISNLQKIISTCK